ncbi:hypothetical protein Tco_0185957 [Tanacetum coccineum]
MKTPMSSDTKLTKDEECESVDSTKYRGMIGSLLYLTANRPDIMFVVCLCAVQERSQTSLEQLRRLWDRKSIAGYLYVRRMLFDILVLEETNRSCYIHYRSRIRKRQNGMSTSTVDEKMLMDTTFNSRTSMICATIKA